MKCLKIFEFLTGLLGNVIFCKNFLKYFGDVLPYRVSDTELRIENRKGFGLLKAEKSLMDFQKLLEFLSIKHLNFFRIAMGVLNRLKMGIQANFGVRKLNLRLVWGWEHSRGPLGPSGKFGVFC